MKKISVVFDGLRFSDSTLQYAMNLADKSDALLFGVFLEDFTYHSYQLLDMVGEEGVSKTKIKYLKKKDEKTRLEACESFIDACSTAGERYVIHHDKSIAIQELLKESIYSDLVLIDNRETFSQYIEKAPTSFIRDLLANVQCPVMTLPSEYKKIEKVVLLYDGKPASVFAIKMFNYILPWMKGLDTEVVTVTDPQTPKDEDANSLIKEFIECHYPDATYHILHGDEKKEIVSYLKRFSQGVLIVLGAYNGSSVSRWFNTSMADVLMKEINNPLFIAHK